MWAAGGTRQPSLTALTEVLVSTTVFIVKMQELSVHSKVHILNEDVPFRVLAEILTMQSW